MNFIFKIHMQKIIGQKFDFKFVRIKDIFYYYLNFNPNNPNK